MAAVVAGYGFSNSRDPSHRSIKPDGCHPGLDLSSLVELAQIIPSGSHATHRRG